MTNDAAVDLVKRGGKNLDELRAAAVKRGFKAVPLNVQAAATLAAAIVAQDVAERRRRAARAPTTSRRWSSSSHYDHFGIRDPRPGDKPDTDRIFNGAYDNASGVRRAADDCAVDGARAAEAGALDVSSCSRPRRSRGCSARSITHSIRSVPLDQIAANINIDDINYLGTDAATSCCSAPIARRSGRWRRRWPRSAAARVGADQHPERGYFFRSDHFPFAKARRAGAVDQRAARVHRSQRRGAEEEAGSLQRAPTITSRATSTIRRGTSAGRSRTAAARAARVAGCCAARDAEIQRRRSVRQRAQEN